MLFIQDMIALLFVAIAITLLLKRTIFSFRGISSGNCTGCSSCVVNTVTGNCSQNHIVTESFQV